MIRDLAKACALIGALSICSCSLLLNWEGYTDGGSSESDATRRVNDATAMDEAEDAPEDVTIEPKDAKQEARGPDDATINVADALDAPEPVEADSPPSMCSPTMCGGCCIPSSSYCYFGNSESTCGVGGTNCQDCKKMGMACGNGVCGAPPQDAGMQGPCVVSSCAHELPIRCFPPFMACCRLDESCGCQFINPPPGVPTGCF